jgi:hypothetical protein
MYAKPVDVLVLEHRFESATLGDLQQLDLDIPSSSRTAVKAVSIWIEGRHHHVNFAALPRFLRILGRLVGGAQWTVRNSG